MLHTLNGFLCGAIGRSLVFILNRGSKDDTHLSPFNLAVMAFGFPMTIGVLWEFVEFTGDHFLYLDMQKDSIVSDIGSISFDDTNSQIPIHISNNVHDDPVVSQNGYKRWGYAIKAGKIRGIYSSPEILLGSD